MLTKADTCAEVSLSELHIPATVPREVQPVNCIENLKTTTWFTVACLQMLPVVIGFAGLLMIVALVEHFEHHARMGAAAADALFFYLFTFHCIIAAYISACCDHHTRATLVRGDVYALRDGSLRELLRWGRLMDGRLTARRGEWLSVSFEEPETGRERVHHFRLAPCFEAMGVNLEPGDRVPLLFDPDLPDEIVSPWSHGAVFHVSQQPEDHRPQTLAVSAEDLLERRCGETEAELNVPLKGSWRQRPCSLKARFKMALRRDRSSSGASLLFRDGLLALEGAHGVRREIDLNAPFHVHLSTWLVSDTHAELNIEISGGATGEMPEKLRFRVLVRQEQVSASLPLKQINAPVLGEQDLIHLWPTLCLCEEARHESLSAVHLAA